MQTKMMQLREINQEEFIILFHKRQIEGKLQNWEIKEELKKYYKVCSRSITTKK